MVPCLGARLRCVQACLGIVTDKENECKGPRCVPKNASSGQEVVDSEGGVMLSVSGDDAYRGGHLEVSNRSIE